MVLEFFMDIKMGVNNSKTHSIYTFDIAYPLLLDDFQNYLVELKLAEEYGEDEEMN